jgi:uncharacterized membrane protein
MMFKFATNNIVVLRHLRVRPRLTAAAILSCLVFFLLLPEHWRTVTKLLTAWDSGIFLYLLLASIMMYNSDSATIRSRAALQDEGSLIILGLTVCSAIASLAAIMAELAAAKGHVGTSLQHVMLTGSTVVLTWLFMQTMFALHYAHEFYNSHSRSNDGGLEFPGHNPMPDYWDFIYFSFVIGTAAQTADINITSKTFRRIVALHSVIVFFFNTTILALTVNVGAGLL